MPPRVWTRRIEDILEAIDSIDRYTAGLSYEAFVSTREPSRL
jgi:uncharacterized protein with HEPN domain